MPASAPGSPPAFARSFAALAPRYDLAFCDIWGVLHNGLRATPPAADALIRFRAGGGTVVLISNAPRPGAAVLRQLDKLAVPRGAFDAIVTSGDLARRAVAGRPGQRLHHIGPERDESLFDGLDAPRGTPGDAEYVVCSGLRDDRTERPEDYRDELAPLAARGLAMICANPDIVVERGDALFFCAGALGALYEELGGEVFYAGKPHRPVYEDALAIAERLRGGAVDASRILAIGDAIRTDVAGGAGFGIDSLFLARGIHAQDLVFDDGGGLSQAETGAWLMRQTARPTWFAESLVW